MRAPASRLVTGARVAGRWGDGANMTRATVHTKVGPARDVRRNEVSATRLHRCVAAVLAIRDTVPEFAILAEA